MTSKGPGHHVKESGGRGNVAEDGLTLRACFAFAGQFTGRRGNYDADRIAGGLAVEGQ